MSAPTLTPISELQARIYAPAANGENNISAALIVQRADLFYFSVRPRTAIF